MSSAADLFAQSLVDMTRSIRDHQDAEKRTSEIQAFVRRWEHALQGAYEDNAANIAEKCALRQQLARYAPDHPLLKNQLLREKIQALGSRAYAISGNFDDARKVGETYFPPGTPPISK